MADFKEMLIKIFEDTIQKAVFSNPTEKDAEFKKITISRMPKFYQITKFTEKQVLLRLTNGIGTKLRVQED